MWIKKKSKLLMLLSTALALTFAAISCTENNTLTGGGTNTGPGMIVGYVYDETGTPAQNAVIRAIPSEALPGLSKSKDLTMFVTSSDSKGKFVIDSLPDGTYNLTGEKDDKRGFTGTIEIKDGNFILDLKITLKKPGGIVGKIKLPESNDARPVLILVYGTQTFTFPKDSSGTFELKGLAEGMYRVRFLPTIDKYTIFDTTLTIQSGVIDTLKNPIRLVYTGTQRVSGVNMKIDTLEGLLTLTWKKNPSDSFGYALYKYAPGKRTKEYTVVKDSFYQDLFSPVWEDSTVYRIRPLNRFLEPDGEFSDSILKTGLQIPTYEKYSDSIHIGYVKAKAIKQIAVSGDALFYVYSDYQFTKIVKQTISTSKVSTIGYNSNEKPEKISISLMGDTLFSIFIMPNKFGVFKAFDLNGNLLEQQNLWQFKDFDKFYAGPNDLFYLRHNESTISGYNKSGKVIDIPLVKGEDSPIQWTANKAFVYYTGPQNQDNSILNYLGTGGTLISNYKGNIAMMKGEFVIIGSNNSLLEKITRYKLPKNSLFTCIDDYGTIWVLSTRLADPDYATTLYSYKR